MGGPDRDIAQAKAFIAPHGYQRHRPEVTLLYQLLAEHYPKFRDRRAAEGPALPRYVEDEFEAYLKCGLLEHGFLSGQVPRLPGREVGRVQLQAARLLPELRDFVARLAALVPKPRAHLTRYHGVFAPASPDRTGIVSKTRAVPANDRGEVSASDRRRSLSWAQRLKRVFASEIETCRRCGGRLRVIASIEAPALIERILEHLAATPSSSIPRIRAARRQSAICRSDGRFFAPGHRAATGASWLEVVRAGISSQKAKIQTRDRRDTGLAPPG